MNNETKMVSLYKANKIADEVYNEWQRNYQKDCGDPYQLTWKEV